VLYVTHDQVEAMVLADRIAVMARGEVLQIGNPFELYRNPANTQVAEFFGSINWIHGHAAREHVIDTDIGPLAVETARRYDGAVMVGIRPEDIKLAPAFTESENRLEGRLVGSTFVGDQVIAEVIVKGVVLTVKAMPDQRKSEGDIAIRLPKERIVVFPEPATE